MAVSWYQARCRAWDARKLTPIARQQLSSQNIPLDGYEYIECTFDGVVFHYEGKAPTPIKNCYFTKSPSSLISSNPVVRQTIVIMAVLTASSWRGNAQFPYSDR